MLEIRLAQAEAKSARLTRDLSGRLAREQRVELAECRALIAAGEEHAREIEPHDAGPTRRDRVTVVRDRIGDLAARVDGRAVRGVQLPARGARVDRLRERLSAGRKVATLERDDREELLCAA